MANLTKYAQTKLINHMLGKAAFTMPTNVWFALFSISPGENGVLDNELTADGYARVAIASKLSASVAGGPVVNSELIPIGPANILWPLATHGAIIDAETAGNALIYAPLTDPVIVDIGKYFEIDVGLLILSLD